MKVELKNNGLLRHVLVPPSKTRAYADRPDAICPECFQQSAKMVGSLLACLSIPAKMESAISISSFRWGTKSSPSPPRPCHHFKARPRRLASCSEIWCLAPRRPDSDFVKRKGIDLCWCGISCFGQVVLFHEIIETLHQHANKLVVPICF